MSKPPIKIRIKTIWQGLVGVHSKYYEEALACSAPILVIHGSEAMEIPAEKVKEIHSKTKEEFLDRFTGEKYHLVYYVWKPNGGQPTLL